MLSKVYCACCIGLSVSIITVEVSITDGIQFFLVGLADSAIKESQQRIASALGEFGYRIPGRRIVINLAPANIRKEGSGFDLAIAIGILTASEQIKKGENIKKELEKTLIVGELALDGSLRSIPGALPIINHAKKMGFSGCILPFSSALEGGEIEGINIYGASNLIEVIKILRKEDFALSRIIKPKPYITESAADFEYDFNQVKGQNFAKWGMEIAAAGGHNLMMVGSQGCGKTLLAKCLPSILPPMTKEESIQISEIYSIANMLNGGLVKQRPFRSPHHTITITALAGGGSCGTPGEISLAHNGVLFLDEIAEFERKTIEVLRQPLENGSIDISRVKNRYHYPAHFMLVAAMNPCPCGHLYDSGSQCKCSSAQISRYQNKISGPILDRIDIFLKLRRIRADEIFSSSSLNHRTEDKYNTLSESSADIAKRVAKARERQQVRYHKEKFFTNATISQRKLLYYCKLGDKEEQYLKKLIDILKLSARGYTRILKIARTIADLQESEEITTAHIASAVQLRNPDS